MIKLVWRRKDSTTDMQVVFSQCSHSCNTDASRFSWLGLRWFMSISRRLSDHAGSWPNFCPTIFPWSTNLSRFNSIVSCFCDQFSTELPLVVKTCFIETTTGLFLCTTTAATKDIQHNIPYVLRCFASWNRGLPLPAQQGRWFGHCCC